MKIISTLLLIFLTSCSSTEYLVKIAPENHKETTKASFTFNDKRPHEEIFAKDPPLWRLVLSAPTDRVGNEHFSTLPISLFKSQLQKYLANQLKGKVVTVNHFEVLHYYPKSYQQSQAASFAAISYPVAIIMAGDSKGLLDTMSCRLSGQVNDNKFSVEYGQAYELGGMAWVTIYESKALRDTVSQVVNQCVSKAITQIKVF